MLIYHITTAGAWAAAQAAGSYQTGSLDHEGFIHFATRAQLRWVAGKFYHGQSGLVLLAVDETRLSAPLRYEQSEPDQEPFPHLYGPLNLDAVVAVHAFPPEPDGSFALPAGA
jgi:uncharacterized protein (DUF952 family)